MKKVLGVLLYTFILLLSSLTIAKTDIFANTETTTESEVMESKIDSNTVNNGNDNTKEEQETIKEEIETDTSDYVETSTEDTYEEENYEEETESYNVNYGTYGRLYVSWFNVALYDYNVNTSSDYSLQSIVDDYDSAAYYRTKGKLVIADHNYQGFSILGSLDEGTIAYIEFEDGSSISYRLTYVSRGYNTGPDLIDYDGNSFFNMESDLIMYTCYNDGIMATLWVLA